MRLLRRLLKAILDDLLRVFDDLVRHIDVVGDVVEKPIGFLINPIYAVVVVAALGTVALYLQDRLFFRRLPRWRELAEADERAVPILTIASEPTLWARLLKRKHTAVSVRIDNQGMVIERPPDVSMVRWDQVARWSRSGLAEWTLYLDRGRFSIRFTGRDHLSKPELERVDQRLALHVTGLPQSTLRDEIQSIQSTLVAALARVKTGPRWLHRFSPAACARHASRIANAARIIKRLLRRLARSKRRDAS